MLTTTHRGDIAIVTMAYGKANTLDPESCQALVDVFKECRDNAARAVILTAEGGIFSAGLDLLRVLDGGARYVERLLPILEAAFEAAFTFPKPLVAAVNGHAFAGGCILALTGDRRIMARGAGRIGVPELLVGVPFPSIAFEIVRSAAATERLAQLVYGGETVVADAAVERGLVDTAVDANRLMEEAVAVAEQLAALPSTAFAITKQQLRAPAMQRVAEGRARVDAEIGKYWESAGALDSIRDYVRRTLKKG